MKTSFSNKLFLCAGALAIGILGDTLARAQTATGGWTNRYNGPGNSDDHARTVAVDGSGNVFVTGFSFGRVGPVDYLTIKYSGAGDLEAGREIATLRLPEGNASWAPAFDPATGRVATTGSFPYLRVWDFIVASVRELVAPAQSGAGRHRTLPHPARGCVTADMKLRME